MFSILRVLYQNYGSTMNGTKFTTLNKSQNQSEWIKQQPKFQHYEIKASTQNPWKEHEKMIASQFPSYIPSKLKYLSKKDQNEIFSRRKHYVTHDYFNRFAKQQLQRQ